MNKKEISEIKKQLTGKHCAITKISGCYVDSGKNIKTDIKTSFSTIPEEEQEKYIEIFRKTLSGTEGKTLINMEIPIAQEQMGGTQAALLALRNSEMQNNQLLNELYLNIIENYHCEGNYYIIFAYGVYDIPMKAKDGTMMDDASDEVYKFILCSICPVNQSKPGLYYNEKRNNIEDRICDWVVGMPENGFLFPAFNDRTADIHNLLYFAKKPDQSQPDFLQNVLGCHETYSAGQQKDLFNGLIAETLDDKCSFHTIINMGERLDESAAEQKNLDEPRLLSGKDIKNILLDCGAPEEKLNDLESQFQDVFTGTNGLPISNLASGGAQIRLTSGLIKVDKDTAPRLEITSINGKKYIAVPIDGTIDINGIIVIE